MIDTTALRAAFDAVAPGYDQVYGGNPIMAWMRSESLAVLEATFPSGSRLLEIGCGTGEEAIHLARRGRRIIATDVSPGMVAITWEKARLAGVSDRISAQVIPACDIGRVEEPEPFDGAYASFGALNCERDLPGFAAALSDQLRPGGQFVCSVMARICPFEIGWFLAHGKPRSAFRRLAAWQSAGIAGANGARSAVVVRYLTLDSLRRAFAPTLHIEHHWGFPILLPPPYLVGLYCRHRRFWERVEALERVIRRLPPFAWMGDHLLIVMRRV